MGFSRTIALSLAFAVAAEAGLPSPKVLDRYRQMLRANPVEGTALDRLWKAYTEAEQTGQLIEQYRKEGTFDSELVLGHLLRRAGQPEEARAAYERAAKLQPTSAVPALALARLHKEAGRPREAAEWFEKASNLLPDGNAQLADTLFDAGQAWISAGDLQRGAAAWERAVALAPQNTELRRRLADSYVANELPERAIPHLEHLVAHAPPSDRAQALQQLARVHRTTGNTDAAIQSLEKAMALTAPGNWLREELQSQLIRLYQRAHRIPELEQRWKRHVEENPRDLGGYVQLVALYERIADLNQKQVWLEKLVKLAPKTPSYRLQLARLYVQQDQLEAAVKLYDQLLTEQPANSDLVFERARIDLLLAAPDKARQRIGAFLVQRKNDESVRSKALEFYQQHRLWRAVEEHLSANAAGGQQDAVIALADFLFSQAREAEAEAQLQRLVHPQAPPQEQAQAWIRIAQTLKGQGRFASASSAVDRALALLPGVVPGRREALLLSGELHSTLGELQPARSALTEAVRMGAPPAEQVDAEQKLFDCLRQIDLASGAETPGTEGLVLPPPEGETPQIPQALSEYLTALRSEAETENSEAAWLRLARWHAWSRDQRSALDAANKAIAVAPQSVAAHEFVVKLSATVPSSVAAHWHLGKLMEVDPPNRVQYVRRVAQLNLQAGNLQEALRMLQSLATEQPGNLDVLTDLAMTQQRSEKWEEALKTWQKVLASSPASRRAEAIGPLVRIHEKLHRPQPAAEILLKEVEAASDPKQQLEHFSELLSFATKQNLLPWLRTEWEKRHKRLGDDYVTEIALGRILKAQGEKAAGFRTLADAALSAPDPSVALPELVREAEEIRRLDEAVHLQERLVRTSAANELDAWLKLAELQEKTFSFEAAGQTWSRIAARFPRDVTALLQASEFWQREDNRKIALDLLRRVRALEPGNARALWALAQLDLDAGIFDEARDCLEQILSRTSPEKPGAPIRFPAVKVEDGIRLQNVYLTTVRSRGGEPTAEAMRDLRTFWSETPIDARGNDKEIRLNAIRELARIIVARNDAAARTQWLQRWKAAADNTPEEALWGLYYADAGETALELVEQLMSRSPQNVQYKQAFIWLGLQARQGERLASWLRAPQRTASERDFLIIALGQHLDSQGEIDPKLLDQLFPASAPSRLWQVASMFASRMRFAEAIRLGNRALTNEKAGRSRAALELAHWYLSMGDAPGAQRVLTGFSDELADSFESPSCAAMRELYLLLPAHERAAFVERKLASLVGSPPVHAALVGALLNGLAGDNAAAKAYLDRLLSMRVMASAETEETGNSTSREWTFYLSTGLHLQSWKLGDLAAYLWEKTLADPALIRLEGDYAREISREMTTKLNALRLAKLSPRDAAIKMEDLFAASANEEVIAVGEALESMGALPHAIALYRRLWEREPSDPQPLRNLLNACRMADDQQTTETVLRACISDHTFPNDTIRRDFAGQLSDLLERKSDIAGALKVASEAVTGSPADLRLLQRLAQLQEKAGNLPEAEAAWRQLLTLDPTHALGRASLANLQEKQDDLPGAISTLTHPEQAEADPLLPLLLLKSQQVEAAFEALGRVPPAKLASATQTLGQHCLVRGQRDLARAAVQAAMERVTDPTTLFQLHTQLVETFAPATESPIILHELRSLRREALKEPKLTAEYFAWLQKKAGSLGAADFASQEFATAWADGAGPLSAGVALIGRHVEAKNHKSVPPVLTRLLARPDANAQLLEGVLQNLENNGLLAIAGPVHERLTQLNPLENQRLVAWAQALDRSGQRPAALAMLDGWGARAWLDDELAGKVAQTYAELGAMDKADVLFKHAIQQDLPRRNYQTFLDYARLQRQRGKLAKAHSLLGIAHRQPACRDFDELVAWSAAAGKIDQLENVLYSLELPPTAIVPAQQALFRFYESQGNVTEALQALSSHPTTRTPAVLAQVRALASRSSAFAACVEALETWLKEVPPDLGVSQSLALIHTDWADSALKEGKSDEALKHLQRAVEVRGDLFVAAQKLALLHEQQGARKEATLVLQNFVKQAREPAEREQARRLVEKIERH